MNYTLELTQEQINIVIDKYQEYELYTTNYYTLFRAKIKLSTLSIYSTNKLLIQGKDADIVYSEICDLLNITPSITEAPSIKTDEEKLELFHEYIGNDEVGTGDFFGPIIVCSSLVTEENYLKVKRLGVKDSKALNDDKIIDIALELVDIVPYCVTILKPDKYNEVYQNNTSMNMNKIKAILHNNVMNKFLVKYPEYRDKEIMLDDFCGEDKYYEYLSKSKYVIRNVIFETKAENKYLSVACSSIIARYYFLKEFARMTEESGYELIKGASASVDNLAAKIIKEKGTRYLSNLAKLNFKNYSKANKILDKQNSITR